MSDELKPDAWEERQARSIRSDGSVEWSGWYPAGRRSMSQPRAIVSAGIPYEWRPLYAYPPEPMTEERARAILANWIEPDNSVDAKYGQGLVLWRPSQPGAVTIDAILRADQLEAIAWWMRNKGAKA